MCATGFMVFFCFLHYKTYSKREAEEIPVLRKDLLHALVLCNIIPPCMLMLICTIWFLSLKGIFSWEHVCVCLGRVISWAKISVFSWYKHKNKFICSSELIPLLSLMLASFTCLQPIVVVRHSAYTFLCTQSNSSWQQLIFLAVAFFLNPPTDVQSAVIHLRCHSTCITS